MGEMTKWPEEKKQAWAVSKLREMQAKHGRLPMKSDFDAATLSRIKSFLGPWPRALEAAELKNSGRNSRQKKKKRSGFVNIGTKNKKIIC